MRFHIKRAGGWLACGLPTEDVYRSESDHLATEAAVENAHRGWWEGDHVCLACVKKARPCSPKQLRACRSVNLGEWVVLCGCGGIRPHGKPCGSSKALPLDRRT